MVLRKERLHLPPKIFVTGRRVGDEGSTLALRSFDRRLVETSDLFPTFRIHEGGALIISNMTPDQIGGNPG
jgi:hypothetical protein